MLAPPENSSQQMSRGSGSDVIYDFHLILSAWRCAESGWKSYTSIPRASTTSPSFPSYTLACVPCARSPALSLPASYFSRWPDSSTWDWIKPKYTCELLLRAAYPAHIHSCRADVLLRSGKKKLGRRGPPPKSKHQWSDSKEGISIGVSLSCASFIYSLLCSGVCNRC